MLLLFLLFNLCSLNSSLGDWSFQKVNYKYHFQNCLNSSLGDWSAEEVEEEFIDIACLNSSLGDWSLK